MVARNHVVVKGENLSMVSVDPKNICCGPQPSRKSLEVPFCLEPLDIKIPTICPLLNIPLIVGKGRLSGNSPSLDRVIPKNGYIKGNVLVVSHRANQIKNDADLKELQTLTKNLEKIWASYT